MEGKFNQQELEKIREWVYGHKEELKEDLRRLVAVPTAPLRLWGKCDLCLEPSGRSGGGRRLDLPGL